MKMQKQVKLMVSSLFIIGILGMIVFILNKNDEKKPDEKKMAMFLQQHQEELEATKTIAFTNSRQLQLEKGRRLWYSTDEKETEKINPTDEINVLYEQLLETQLIVSIFEGALSNDQGTITYPALRFENYYKDSRTTYETIGCVYVQSEEPLDVKDYRLNQLVHLTGKWYYFRIMPQT